MSIIEERTFSTGGFTNDDVIMYAYLCSNADKKDDPIDRAIVNAMEKSSASADGWTQTEIIGFNPSVKRVVAFAKDQSTGNVVTIAKGLPAKILDTSAGAKGRNHASSPRMSDLSDFFPFSRRWGAPVEGCPGRRQKVCREGPRRRSGPFH